MHGLNSPRRVRPSFQVRPASCSPTWQSQDQKPRFRAGCGSKDPVTLFSEARSRRTEYPWGSTAQNPKPHSLSQQG